MSTERFTDKYTSSLMTEKLGILEELYGYSFNIFQCNYLV